MAGEEKPSSLQLLAYYKVLFYLRVLKKKIIGKDDSSLRITIREEVPYAPNQQVDIGIMITRNWVRIFTILFDDFDISSLGSSAVDVLAGLLRLQDEYMEFNFGLSKANELVIKEDIYIKALTLDVFLEEYNAILEAYKKFRKVILPKIKEGSMSEFDWGEIS